MARSIFNPNLNISRSLNMAQAQTRIFECICSCTCVVQNQIPEHTSNRYLLTTQAYVHSHGKMIETSLWSWYVNPYSLCPFFLHLRAIIVDAINTPTSAPRIPTTIIRVYSSNLATTGDPALARLSVALRNEYTTTPVTNPATEYARKTSGSESMKLRR